MTTSPSSSAAVSNVHERRGFIGGSDAASILGVSPWRSAFRCWCEKRGEVEPADLSGEFYVYWGNVLEDVVAQEFARRSGLRIKKEPRLLRARKHPFIGGHIDRRILVERTFLECKTSNAWDYSHWGHPDAGREGIPLHYLAQCDHYMMVLNSADHCYLAALIGGSDYRVYRIERSSKAESELLAAEVEFWRQVEEDDPPMVESESDARLRWRLAQEGSAIAIDQSTFDKVAELSVVQESIKQYEGREKKLRDEIVPLFEDKESLVFNGRRVARLTNYATSRFDLDRFKKEKPKLCEKYYKKGISKRLKVSV